MDVRCVDIMTVGSTGRCLGAWTHRQPTKNGRFVDSRIKSASAAGSNSLTRWEGSSLSVNVRGHP